MLRFVKYFGVKIGVRKGGAIAPPLLLGSDVAHCLAQRTLDALVVGLVGHPAELLLHLVAVHAAALVAAAVYRRRFLQIVEKSMLPPYSLLPTKEDRPGLDS